MNLLIVDETRCRKDGICARECPTQVISFSEGSYPEMVPWGDKGCTRCGHCVAVCPHGALSHTEVPLARCSEIRKELAIGEKQAEQFLRSRRSIRSFQDKPVKKETIRKLIEIARYAPTGGNTQTVEWLVITDRTVIRKLALLSADVIRRSFEADPRLLESAPYLPMIVKACDNGIDAILRDAPALIVASAPEQAINGMVDLTLALSYLDLMAPVMGLGACWAGLFQRALLTSPTLKEALGLPVDHPFHYSLMAGYPTTRYYRLPERKAPKITFR